MRVIVPLSIALVSIGLWPRFGSAAGSGTWPAYRDNTPECKQNESSKECTPFKVGFCRAHSNATGCNASDGNALPAASSYWQSSGSASEKTSAAMGGLKSLQENANGCCEAKDMDRCNLPPGDAHDAKKSLSSDSQNGDSLKRVAEIGLSRSSLKTVFIFGVVGECLGRKDACLFQIDEMKKVVSKLKSADAAEANRQIADYEKACTRYSEQDLRSNLQAAIRDTEKAADALRKTSSSDSTPRSSHPMSFSDIAAIAGMGSNLLNQYLAQDQQPFNPNPTDAGLPAADCSNPAMVGGSCPAQPLAPTSPPIPFAKVAMDGDGPGGAAKGAFNPAENADNAGAAKAVVAAAPSGAPTIASVPGGGGFSGGGGGGQGASLAAVAPPAAAPPAKSFNLGNESGGGGYSQQAALNPGEGFSGYGGGREPASESGLDWSQFLPGHSKDPRKLAGLAHAESGINSKDVNIWTMISEHIRARCSQGLLRDCIP